MNYPPLQFVCEGGPLNGITKKGFAAPSRAAGHRTLKEGIDIGKVLEIEYLLVQTYVDGQRGQGRYKITFDGEKYHASHIPSSDDVDFPVKEEESNG